ncbi:hypothetical protein ACFW2V_06495 [Streptomyces sp. NPDC058947]|uniref:hypothetical protein n=1 Tax=Streptomyces sp. NPDC058947 TaxID=3346675 RepID=UPI0036A51497
MDGLQPTHQAGFAIWFHNTALGPAFTTTNGMDAGIVREPVGTLISLSKESGILEVNEKRKLKIFAAVSGVVSVAALVQGFLTNGSGKVTLLTLGALGIVGIGMLTYAMQDRKRWRRNG